MKVEDSRTLHGGFLPLGHDNWDQDGYDEFLRTSKIVVRVQKRLEQTGHYVFNADHIGDWCNGGIIWPRDERDINGYQPAWPVKTVSPGNILPLLNKEWETTGKQFKELAPGVHPDHPAFCNGYAGIALTAQDTRAQYEVFMPTDPRLFAVNANGDINIGSRVYDLQGIGDRPESVGYNPGDMARLQSAWRVLVGPTGYQKDQSTDAGIFGTGENALAWNITNSGQEDTHGGWIWDKDRNDAIAAVSQQLSGPWEAFCGSGKHQLGEDAEGRPIFANHLSLNSYFTDPGGIYDGPLKHDGVWKKAGRGPFSVEVKFEYDQNPIHSFVLGPRQGKHRWRALTHFYTPEFPPWTPTPTPVPPGEPPTETPPETPGGPGVPITPGGGRPVLRPALQEPSAQGPYPKLPPPVKKLKQQLKYYDPDLEPGVYVEGEKDALRKLNPVPEKKDSKWNPDNEFTRRKQRREALEESTRPKIQPIDSNVWKIPQAATTMEVAGPSWAARPQLLLNGATDYRYWQEPTTEAIAELDSIAPIVGRVQTWGKQLGGDYVYTEGPCRGRYPGGTASGGFHVTRPEYDITELLGTVITPAYSDTYWSMESAVRFGWGTPSTSVGGLVDSCEFRYDGTDTLTLQNYDSSGAAIAAGAAGDTQLTIAGDVVAGVTQAALGEIGKFFAGTTRESFDALVTSDGATVTMSLEQTGTGDLTMQFSSGVVTLDCTPAATIALTAGTDSSPQANYIYIPEATQVLTKSTSGWPATEHIRIGYFLVPSAGTTQTLGCYVNQNWNDHLAGTDNQGHMAHIGEKCRVLGATYYSGIAGNGASDYFTMAAGSTHWASTAGVVYQLHRHAFPAVSTAGGDTLLVKNWSGDAYHDITDLFSITADSGGNTINNNRYFNLVFWGIGNKTNEYETVVVNLPSGDYTVQSDAENDVDKYDDYSMPREFTIDSGTGFLICRATFQMGATWSHVATVDLRGRSQFNAAGSGVNDHGLLGGLADDDHTQYLLADGTRALAGDWALGGYNLTNAGNITLADASAINWATNGSISRTAANQLTITADDQVIFSADAKVTTSLGVGVAAPSVAGSIDATKVKTISPASTAATFFEMYDPDSGYTHSFRRWTSSALGGGAFYGYTKGTNDSYPGFAVVGYCETDGADSTGMIFVSRSGVAGANPLTNAGAIPFRFANGGVSGASTLGEFSAAGQLLLPKTGSSAGLLIGGDATAYRSAAAELTIGSDAKISRSLGVGVAPTAATGDIKASDGTNILFADMSIPRIYYQGAGDNAFYMESYNTGDTNDARLLFAKSGNATVGSYTATTDGEQLGTIQWAGTNSGATSFGNAGQVICEQVGAAGASFVGSKLSFYSSTSAAGPTLGMVINEVQQTLVDDGGYAAPGLAAINDTDAGINWGGSGAGTLGFGTGGTCSFYIDSSQDVHT